MSELSSIIKTASGIPSLDAAILDNIFIEAAKDLVKDEVKVYIKKKIEEDPELQQELREAVKFYMEAKVREAYAGFKITKASTQLTYSMIPENIRDSLGKELREVIEKNVLDVLEDSI